MRAGALVLTILVWGSGVCLSEAAEPTSAAGVDADGNGVEDLLDKWYAGDVAWSTLRDVARSYTVGGSPDWPDKLEPESFGPWARGQLRLLVLGKTAVDLAPTLAGIHDAGGVGQVIHDLSRFGGVSVLAVDPVGLAGILAEPLNARIMLDRDGRPALDHSRSMVGSDLANLGPWNVEGDWRSSVAILDSGCDTAHNDLGDFASDNIDGPPPAVGHALDWFAAEFGWPAFSGYKVIGWQDVTDDFPQAAGPWDYHYHGTALAGVVAGSGVIDSDLHGVARNGRLTVVKFYDFDVVWHQWAGDFLAACDWVLAHQDTYRIRIMLASVNWEVDAGIRQAMEAMLAAGILPVVAAGNDGLAGTEPGYPARLAEVLTVGGINDNRAVAAFSQRFTSSIDKPDLMAPSGGTSATMGRITTTDNEPNDTYSGRWGTSLAAAHAAAGAFLLLEALQSEGVPPPTSAAEAREVAYLLKSTTAVVVSYEDSSGQNEWPLAPTSQPNPLYGWGQLQVYAAIEAALHTITIGTAASDSLGEEFGRYVMARRLPVFPRGRYEVVAEASGDLDIALEVHHAQWIREPTWGWEPWRRDTGGPGGSESLQWQDEPGGLVWVVVKRLAGNGIVTLNFSDGPGTGTHSFSRILGGEVTAWPNVGYLSATQDPSVVLTSFSEIDPFTRLVHALNTSGQERPGWPVFIFLPSSLNGPLSAPLVWDLDGQPPDEVIVASDFGKVFVIDPDGTYESLDVTAANMALTAPVGIIDEAGLRYAVVIDASGTLHRLDAAGNLVESQPLVAAEPLAPAVGQISAADGEEMVILFENGILVGLDAAGSDLPGWPVDLGPGSLQPPVLVDLDVDGLHEVVVPVLSEVTGTLVYRVLSGDGTWAGQDGSVSPAPGGGEWMSLSAPAVMGSHATGSLRIVQSGLVDHGTIGETVFWTLANSSLGVAGDVSAQDLAGFQIRVTTPAGQLRQRWEHVSTPLAYDFQPGAGTESEHYLSLGWEEVISGIPDPKGSQAAWYRNTDSGPALDQRHSLWIGGNQSIATGRPSSVLLPVASESWLRITCQDRNLVAQQTHAQPSGCVPWPAERADGRNSGSYPLSANPPVSVIAPTGLGPRIIAWPNPGNSAVKIRWQGIQFGSATLDVFDLSGRRVRRLRLSAENGGELSWNGRDDQGRTVAAGSYLLVLKYPGGTISGRAIIVR